MSQLLIFPTPKRHPWAPRVDFQTASSPLTLQVYETGLFHKLFIDTLSALK